jgi:hypothetical protein
LCGSGVRQGHCELLNEFLPEPGLLTQQNPRLDQNFALFLTAFDKIPTNQPPKKSTTKGTDCSQQVQKEAHREANGTAARRKRAYQNGVNEGIAKGRAEAQEKEYQRGFEEGKKLAHATSQSTAEALSKRACDLQIQLADTARREFQATATAADFVVQCQQRNNRIAELEGTLENEVQRSEELQRIVAHQAGELEELRKFQSPGQSSLPSSAQLFAAAASKRATYSSYLNRKPQLP